MQKEICFYKCSTYTHTHTNRHRLTKRLQEQKHKQQGSPEEHLFRVLHFQMHLRLMWLAVWKKSVAPYVHARAHTTDQAKTHQRISPRHAVLSLQTLCIITAISQLYKAILIVCTADLISFGTALKCLYHFICVATANLSSTFQYNITNAVRKTPDTF